MSRRLLPASALLLGLAGCGSIAEPPTGPCAVQPHHAAAARPEPDVARAALLNRIQGGQAAVPPGLFERWFSAQPLERFIRGSAGIAGVTHTLHVSGGAFPAAGSRRLVCLADGGTALEEVLAHEPGQRLRYLVWDYTSASARPLAYGLGEFVFSPSAGGTAIHWTYSFELRPDAFPGQFGAIGRLMFRRAFLDSRYARFMQSIMTAIETAAEQDLR